MIKKILKYVSTNKAYLIGIFIVFVFTLVSRYMLEFYTTNNLVFNKEREFDFMLWVISTLLMCIMLLALLINSMRQDKKIYALTKHILILEEILKETQDDVLFTNHNISQQIRDTHDLLIKSGIVRDTSD